MARQRHIGSAVETWQALRDAGLAGAVLDGIVRTQPVPAALVQALAEAPLDRRKRLRGLNPRLFGHGRELSPQEARVLDAAASGLSAKETAALIGVSRETVKSHVASARAKLGARTITHAVALWLRDPEAEPELS